MIETNHKKSIYFFLLYKLHPIWQNKSTRQYLVKLFCCYLYYNDDTAKLHTEKNDGRKDQNKVNDNLVICPRRNNDDFALDKEQEEAQMESEVRGIATHYSRFKRLDSSAL